MTAQGHVHPEILAERNNPQLMARRKAQAEQDRREDERHTAEAIGRFDDYLETTSTALLPKPTRTGGLDEDGYLAVRRAAGPGFLSAWPVLIGMLRAELEVLALRADGKNAVRRLTKVVRVTGSTEGRKHSQKEIEDARAEGAARVRRETMQLPVGAMPPGPVGDALRELQHTDPDGFQIVNLRMIRENGRPKTFRRIAQQFRRKGAENREEYTAQRCQQILSKVLRQHPKLKAYIDGDLTDKRTGRLPEAQESDHDFIESQVNQSAFDSADYGRGFHPAALRPRKPV